MIVVNLDCEWQGLVSRYEDRARAILDRVLDNVLSQPGARLLGANPADLKTRRKGAQVTNEPFP